VLDRTELTQAWLAQINPELRPTLDQAMNTWWRNIRDTGGLGLSDTGYEWLVQELELPVWQYHIPHKGASSMSLRRMLTLDRHCPCVYWFRASSRHFELTLFDSREAVAYQLYGDLDRYLAALASG
jgi:hypothetical protein